MMHTQLCTRTNDANCNEYFCILLIIHTRHACHSCQEHGK